MPGGARLRMPPRTLLPVVARVLAGPMPHGIRPIHETVNPFAVTTMASKVRPEPTLQTLSRTLLCARYARDGVIWSRLRPARDPRFRGAFDRR